MTARYRFFPLPLQYACLVLLAIALPTLVWGGGGSAAISAATAERMALPAARAVPPAGAHLLPSARSRDPVPEPGDTSAGADSVQRATRAAV
jgi:hypothetical protein